VEATHSFTVKVKPPAKTFALTDTITKSGSTVDGSIAMNYAGLVCSQAKCAYKGIVPNVTVVFTETAKSSKHPFVKWMVNGAKRTGTSVSVKITKKTTVAAVYK